MTATSSASISGCAIGPGPWRAAGGCEQRPAHAQPAARTTVERVTHQVIAAGLGDGGQHLLEQLVGSDALAERVVGEHDPVAQHVGGEVADVVG